MCVITAMFEWELFSDPSSGYTSHKAKLVNSDEDNGQIPYGSQITICGYYLPSYEGILFAYKGEWKKHPKYGWQFNATESKEIVQKTKRGIVAFLSCGLIKGVSEKTADKIFAEFGTDTMEILDRDPEQLLKIKGISKKKLQGIIESYNQNRNARDVISFLAPHGVTTPMCMKIYTAYKQDTMGVIREEPYKICDIQGMSFKVVDEIAKSLHLPLDTKERVRAAINYLLIVNESTGNVGYDANELFQNLKYILGTPILPNKLLNETSAEMIRDKSVIIGRAKAKDGEIEKNYVYRPVTYEKETSLAQAIVTLSQMGTKVTYDIDKEISDAEKELHITLHEQQREAVKQCLSNSFCVVTGGPGTGKTSTLLVIYHVFHKMNPKKNVEFLSPTGKAARRMAESTGQTATTVHSALGLTGNDEYESDIILESDLIILDEASMADLWLSEKLLNAVKNGASLVFLGDVDQLPSVGCGAILHDIIQSGICPVVMLTKIFRQDGDSNILLNTMKVRNGNFEMQCGNDFKICEASSEEDMAEKMALAYQKEAEIYGIENVVCLIPVRKGIAGVNEMNKRLQNIINPLINEHEKITFRGVQFRRGDIVMQLKNEQEVANGDVGTIEEVGHDRDDGDYVTVRFFEKTLIRYAGETISHLTLAYAMTIHKSQGSEYTSVITCLSMLHPKVMLKRNLFYTAISRGKQKVTVIGNNCQEAIRYAVMHPDNNQRKTLLIEKLIYYGVYKKLKEAAKDCPF